MTTGPIAIDLCCPRHGSRLQAAGEGTSLRCDDGCSFPVANGIPRIVESERYASAFGWQWNKFRRTQLDSHTGTTVSQDRLTRCLGGNLSVVRGRSVLEAGCGAGRFTEVLLGAGAEILACDLSSAIDANALNVTERGPRDGDGHVSFCQASIDALPVARESFDWVICLGVVQHTPDPAATIRSLAACVKPGGRLVIDHYSLGHDYPLPRRIMRRLMLALPSAWASPAALAVSRMLARLHAPTWQQRTIPLRLRQVLRPLSPLVDYYDSYPQLSREILMEWCVLDTHDAVTDVYKHLRSVEQVADDVRAAGLTILRAAPGGNGVEVIAQRPGAAAGGVA
jgi:SAM-dependent methyltransferase